MDQKGLKYMKNGFLDQKYLFFVHFFKRNFGYLLPPKQKLVCRTKLAALGVTICIWKNPDTLKSSRKFAVIWKNPDSFEIIRKIGSHVENPDSFEIIQKIGSHLEKFGQF